MITLKTKRYTTEELEQLYDVLLTASMQAEELYPQNKRLNRDLDKAPNWLAMKIQSTETGCTRQ